MYEHVWDVKKKEQIHPEDRSWWPLFWLNQLKVSCWNKIKIVEAQMWGCQCAICDVLGGKSTGINGDQSFSDGKLGLTGAVEHKHQQRIASMYGFICKKKAHIVWVDINRQESGELKQDWIKKVIPQPSTAETTWGCFVNRNVNVQSFHLRHQGCRPHSGWFNQVVRFRFRVDSRINIRWMGWKLSSLWQTGFIYS